MYVIQTKTKYIWFTLQIVSSIPEIEPFDDVLESKTPGDDADNGGGVVISVTIERLPFSFNSCSTL